MIYHFLNQIRDITNKFFPNANIDYKIVRATHLYFRITIGEDRDSPSFKVGMNKV